MENMTIVTGHKNPDTDSICCALTYTYVKQQLGVPAVGWRGWYLQSRQSQQGNPIRS